MTNDIAAIRVCQIRKIYGATTALDDVSFSVKPGTVHALLGENGAGKSTIVKLLSGLVSPDAGGIEVFGQPAQLHSPRAAHRLGIQTAFQEMTLVRNLTVLDNILILDAPVGLTGMMNRKRASREVSAHFRDMELHSVQLDDEIDSLDLGVRQKIEIARAVFRQPKILLLDEPTSALSGPDVDWLGRVISRLKQKGTTIMFISHRLREVRDFCDELTILRGGKHIASGDVADYDDSDVVRMIAGRSLIHSFPPRTEQRHTIGAEVLRAEGIGTEGKLRDASFSLKEGEILGIAGLQGMGQLDFFLSIFGVAPLSRGNLFVDGKRVAIASPRDAISARIGISLVPEDRKTEGLFLKLSGKHNATIPIIDRFVRHGLIDKVQEQEAVEQIFKRVEVDGRALWSRVDAFSGGNQQKIAIAKWLLSESHILMVYDPTRGIDVGTKNELYQLLRAYAEAGGAVIFYSTEVPELVHLCDRVMVFYAGKVATELSGSDLTEENILSAALGTSSKAAAA
jgi:ribose transport system ATP-binding protein